MQRRFLSCILRKDSAFVACAKTGDGRDRQREADRTRLGAGTGLLIDRAHDGGLFVLVGNNVDHILFVGKADAEELAAKLQGVSLTIGAKTSSTGTIFGSVTNIQVAEALAKIGFEIDRKIISIKESVKEVGQYKATLKLHKEVSVEIPFEVVSE